MFMRIQYSLCEVVHNVIAWQPESSFAKTVPHCGIYNIYTNACNMIRKIFHKTFQVV